ncbi:hypothetical protein V8D89_008605 [Ganoderma adspersum]
MPCRSALAPAPALALALALFLGLVLVLVLARGNFELALRANLRRLGSPVVAIEDNWFSIIDGEQGVSGHGKGGRGRQRVSDLYSLRYLCTCVNPEGKRTPARRTVYNRPTALKGKVVKRS